jgi:hypothetical protein
MDRNNNMIIDIVHWGQTYVEDKGKDNDLKQRIIDAASNIEKLHVPIAIDSIKRAINEGMEEAILYDPTRDIHRVYELKEITKEEYESNPVKKAYEKYAGAIKFRVGGLDIACILSVITETKTMPSYEKAVDKALKIAEKHIKTICKETKCDAKIAAYLTYMLISRTCSMAYDVYHRAKFDELNNYIKINSEKEIELLKLTSQSTNNAEKEEYQKKIDELDKQLEEKGKQYRSNIYQVNELDKLTADIISRLFPSDSVPKEKVLFSIPKTKYPDSFIIPKDKISNKLFEGALTIGTVNRIATEGKKSKKELTAKVSIGFDELKGITISRDLNSYDREIHDAIVSLYVDGGNEYITPLMIYRTMTGNPKAKITPKQFQAISDSVIKCSVTRIRIDAKDEATAYGMDRLIYEGNLIYTKKIEGEHKGETNEWIYIMERPVLFDYAESKGQIDRANIKLLNTPVSKNEETIILQGYLLRRIRTMQKSKVSRNILYETIYKQLNIEAATAGALRKKQTKVRHTVKEILDYWMKEKEIKNYKENLGKNNAIISLSILLN